MIDPPRREVRKAMREAMRAGITIKIITGDSAFTTSAIAEKIAAVKRVHGFPTAFGVSYAKNSVKHLKHIIQTLAEAGIDSDSFRLFGRCYGFRCAVATRASHD